MTNESKYILCTMKGKGNGCYKYSPKIIQQRHRILNSKALFKNNTFQTSTLKLLFLTTYDSRVVLLHTQSHNVTRYGLKALGLVNLFKHHLKQLPVSRKKSELNLIVNRFDRFENFSKIPTIG